jgi:hypothetical protein
MTKEDEYQDWIQWVEAKKIEQVSSYFPNIIHYVQIPRIGSLFDTVDTSSDENRWTKICVRIQFNPRLTEL